MVEATAEAGVAAAVVAGEVVPVALEVLAAMAPVVKWPPEVATSVAAEAVPVGVVEVPLTNPVTNHYRRCHARAIADEAAAPTSAASSAGQGLPAPP